MSDTPSRKRRERSGHTLTITGHGASLRVDAGTLLIRNGFTHYPQQREEYRYFRGDLDRPAQIVILDGSGSISFDVLDWLTEQEIPLIRINWQGDVTAVIGGSGMKYDPEKMRWQELTRANNSDRISFCRSLIGQKIDNCVSTLQACLPPDAMARPIHLLRENKVSLGRISFRSVDELRGLEGNAGRTYFQAISGIRLNWRVSKTRPIPASWHSIDIRSADRVVRNARNARASHPFHAMLNYGYAVLLGRLRIENAAAGYNPFAGIMHSTDKGSPAYLLDLMEPLRPRVDRAILQLVLGQELHPADFVIRADGVVRLNPQLARRVVDLAIAALP